MAPGTMALFMAVFMAATLGFVLGRSTQMVWPWPVPDLVRVVVMAVMGGFLALLWDHVRSPLLPFCTHPFYSPITSDTHRKQPAVLDAILINASVGAPATIKSAVYAIRYVDQ